MSFRLPCAGLALLVAVWLCPSVAHGAEAVFPSNEDLRHVRTLNDPLLAPDGRRVLLQVADATAEGGRTHLWVIDVANNRSRQISYSPAADKGGEHNARWLADGEGGSILFLAKRAEHTQLFRLPLSGGEARAYELSVAPTVDASSEPQALPPKKPDEPAPRRDPLPLDVEAFEPAPDGHLIAVIAPDPETPGEKKQKDEKADALWVDHDPHRKRLFLVDPETSKLTLVALDGDVASIAWAKQGDRLMALVEPANHASDLGPATSAWLIETAKPDHPTRIAELPPSIQSSAWSDDGTQIYFHAQATHDAPPGYQDLYVLRLQDRAVRDLTAEFDGTVGNETPIPVAGDVIEAVQTGFNRGYARVHDGRPQVIHFESAVVSKLSCDVRHTACVWLGQSGAQPNALYYVRALGGAARTLSTPSLLPGRWTSPPPRALRWPSEGLTIEGLLYLPPQAAVGKVPLIVNVHGGPTGAWTDTFDSLTQFFLGHGWAVLRPNLRGSTGYGAAFAAANKNDLGGGDYRDLMAGVDSVIAQFPIDPDKLALIGYSYGGEMAGFVEGKTERFKAIVSGAPVIDQQSEYGTEGDSWYDRWFYGKPWEHAEDAWRQSPLAGAAHAKTPFLLIQGESDTNDPLGQSLEMYRALRQEGVKVDLVQYPREDHGPLSRAMHGAPTPEPWHGFDVRQRLIKFIGEAFQ
jgi:dipeptidyl aminopeptidase/acylaminoacyl peptidase